MRRLHDPGVDRRPQLGDQNGRYGFQLREAFDLLVVCPFHSVAHEEHHIAFWRLPPNPHPEQPHSPLIQLRLRIASHHGLLSLSLSLSLSLTHTHKVMGLGTLRATSIAQETKQGQGEEQ